MSHTTVNIEIRVKKNRDTVPSYRLLYDGIVVAERRLGFDVRAYYNKESLTLRDDDAIHRVTLKNTNPAAGQIWIEAVSFRDGDTTLPLDQAAAIEDNGFTFMCRCR